MEIRNVTWRGFGEDLSMPAPEFAVSVLESSDAIAWGHWSPRQVTFAGITQSAGKWSKCIMDHFNEAEKSEYASLRLERKRTFNAAKRNK